MNLSWFYVELYNTMEVSLKHSLDASVPLMLSMLSHKVVSQKAVLC